MLFLLIIVVIFTTACASLFGPEAMFKNNAEIKNFLNDYPDADFSLVHFSSEESVSEFSRIKEICGKELKEGKELYKAEIKDVKSGLSITAYLDVKNQQMECVRKFGTPPEDPCICPGETEGGHRYCWRVFGMYLEDDATPNLCDCVGAVCKCLNCWEDERRKGKEEEPPPPDTESKSAITPPSIKSAAAPPKDPCICPGETEGGTRYCWRVFGMYLEDDATPNLCDCIGTVCKCLNCWEAERIKEEPKYKCPAVVSISYDKDTYGVGNTILMTFKAFDKKGDIIPNQELISLGYQDGKSLAEETIVTDSSGALTVKKVLNEGDIGIYEHVVFVKKSDCPYVSGVNHFSVIRAKAKIEPESLTKQRSNCPAKIDLKFDKADYIVGDRNKITVDIYDKAGNRLQNTQFFVTAIKNGKDLGIETHTTDSAGYFVESSTITQENVGEYVYRAYVKESGCDYIIDQESFTISPKPEEQALSSCPSKIYLEFNKDSYTVGDKLIQKVVVYDSKGNFMYGKKFLLTQTKENGEKNTNELQTSSDTGVFLLEGILEEFVIGEYNYEASVEDAGCARLSATKKIKISSSSAPSSPPLK